MWIPRDQSWSLSAKYSVSLWLWTCHSRVSLWRWEKICFILLVFWTWRAVLPLAFLNSLFFSTAWVSALGGQVSSSLAQMRRWWWELGMRLGGRSVSRDLSSASKAISYSGLVGFAAGEETHEPLLPQFHTTEHTVASATHPEKHKWIWGKVGEVSWVSNFWWP